MELFRVWLGQILPMIALFMDLIKMEQIGIILASSLAVGVVIYTGRETRSQKNSSNPQNKDNWTSPQKLYFEILDTIIIINKFTFNFFLFKNIFLLVT